MRLLFLGDFLCQSESVPEDLKCISKQMLRFGDKAIVNLEGPFADPSTKKRKKRGPNICQGKAGMMGLLDLNTVGVCLANNHMMDYNEDGLFSTVSTLDEMGVGHTGAGKDLDAATKPLLIDDNGSIISVLNFGWKYEETVYATKNTPGCSPLELDLVISKIESEKSKGHTVICVFHWGFEFNLYPMPYYRSFAYKCIDAGAELIVGHHPHNIQPFEEYKGHKIFYSLGNFYMGNLRNDFNTDYGIEGVEYYSDFGAGLVFDTATKACEGISIIYDRKTETSSFNGQFEFEDISGLSFDSDRYHKQTVEGIHGINPMLTLDDVANRKILNKHLRVCQFYNAFKWVRKIPLFDRAYNLAKKCYVRVRK